MAAVQITPVRLSPVILAAHLGGLSRAYKLSRDPASRTDRNDIPHESH